MTIDYTNPNYWRTPEFVAEKIISLRNPNLIDTYFRESGLTLLEIALGKLYVKRRSIPEGGYSVEFIKRTLIDALYNAAQEIGATGAQVDNVLGYKVGSTEAYLSTNGYSPLIGPDN